MPVSVLHHRSPALEGNPLGDPAERRLHLILPEDLDPTEPVPCVWYLAGYAGVGRSMLSDSPWQEGLEERLLRLRAEGRIGKMIVALPDAFTRLGGAQYLSSSAIGDYEPYLLRELRAAVEARYSISAHGGAGKSSGGFGVLSHAMRHRGAYEAVACSSGDMGFELSIFPELPALMNALRDHGGVEGFLAAFDRAKKKPGRFFSALSMLALAAAYSPDPAAPAGIALPFDLSTGALKEAVLDRWRAHDPVRAVDRPEVQDNLRALRLLYIDCGDRDEHALHWGALQLHTKLKAAQIPHDYERFDDGHRSTGYRLDVILPKLYEALAR